MALRSVNPATGNEIQSYNEHTPDEVNAILEELKGGADLWRQEDFDRRNQFALALADALEAKKETYAKLITREMGKPISQAVAEIEKCATICRYYAENAHGFLQPYEVQTKHHLSEVHYEPLGLILAVMPWNFPFWQAFRAAVPAIMAGNTVALKHASNVTGCALAVEDIFRQASEDRTVLKTLLIPGNRVEKLLEHPTIAAVTLTGSTATGKKIAAAAGAQIKKQVLELGGSDPYIILEDADLRKTAKACTEGRMMNAGQSCIAAKRLLVHRQRVKDFEKALLAEVRNFQMGDPEKEGTMLGPMARPDLRDELHAQVTQSKKEGAKVLLGGEKPDQEGAWYPATILTDVTPGMTCAREETFGPVAVIIPVESVEQAVAVANDTVYGLGAAVFSQDEIKALEVAKRLHAGSVFINTFVKSDPKLPFGGIRESGYGREMSMEGIREFTNVKTVVVSR